VAFDQAEEERRIHMKKWKRWILVVLCVAFFGMAATQPTDCEERREKASAVLEKGGDVATGLTPLIGPLGAPIAGVCYLVAAILGKKKEKKLKKMHRCLTDTVEAGKVKPEYKEHILKTLEWISICKAGASAADKELWELETAIRKGLK
jgi:hypothetical protein